MATYPQRTGTPRARPLNAVSYVCFMQGVYFLLSGVWPLVNLAVRFSPGVSGDVWLATAAGIYSLAIGCVLILAGWRRLGAEPEIALLGSLTSGGLAIADLWRAPKSPTPGTYIVDATFHIVLVLLWVILWRRRRTALPVAKEGI